MIVETGIIVKRVTSHHVALEQVDYLLDYKSDDCVIWEDWDYHINDHRYPYRDHTMLLAD